MKEFYFTIKVCTLTDKYFGRTVTEDPKEIEKVFNHYANFKMVKKVGKKGELIQHLDNYSCVKCGEQEAFLVRIQVFASYEPTESDVDTRELVEHYSMSYTY